MQIGCSETPSLSQKSKNIPFLNFLSLLDQFLNTMKELKETGQTTIFDEKISHDILKSIDRTVKSSLDTLLSRQPMEERLPFWLKITKIVLQNPYLNNQLEQLGLADSLLKLAQHDNITREARDIAIMGFAEMLELLPNAKNYLKDGENIEFMGQVLRLIPEDNQYYQGYFRALTVCLKHESDTNSLFNSNPELLVSLVKFLEITQKDFSVLKANLDVRIIG